MVELTAKLLGTPQVLFEGREIVLPYKKADALLYFLILNRKALRSELTGLLWTDSDSTTALKNLRHAAYSIRKAIGYNLLQRGSVLYSNLPRKSIFTVMYNSLKMEISLPITASF